jgi:hypothetical protein
MEHGFRFWLQTWAKHRAAIGRYYLSTIAIAQRRHLLRQAYRHVMAAVRMAVSKGSGLLRVQPMVEAIFAKLSFNQGQGLWNTFDIAQEDQAGLLTLLQLPRFAQLDKKFVVSVVTVVKQELLRAYYGFSLHPGSSAPHLSEPSSPSKALPIRTFCLLEAATSSPPRSTRRHLQELAAPYSRAISLHRQMLPTPAELMSSIL